MKNENGLPCKARLKIGNTVVDGVIADVRPSSEGGILNDEAAPLVPCSAPVNVAVALTIDAPKRQECPRCFGAKILDGEYNGSEPRGCDVCNGFGVVNANRLCTECGGSGCVPGATAGELLTCDKCDGNGYLEG